MDFNVDLQDITKAGVIKNASKTIGMNEAGIDTLAMDTMQMAMIANDYLNKIIDIMNSTKEHYQCEAADEMRRRFNDFSADFPIVIQNIENYAYSLKKAKSKRVEGVQDAIVNLKQATANVDELIKNQ
ncbi:MAG: hypothetical protein E7171_08335 [Firmicutes bacterium]|nr:hypothetical protein [Bacillota bacterium]